MAMRFGVQTILWGHAPIDYERMFDIIADAGFEGVEMFQHPDDLPTLPKLLDLLTDRGLELLGLTNGSLERRVKYLNDAHAPAGWNPRAPYLYLDRWGKEVPPLLREGYRLAVHPHYLKQIETASDAMQYMENYPELLYIPDTAHSDIKREKVLESINRYSRPNRLASVHLKDWRPGFGRASAFYARGFTELGKGSVDLKLVLGHLAKINYDGWVLVEQDYTEGMSEESLQEAARWLAKTRDSTHF